MSRPAFRIQKSIAHYWIGKTWIYSRSCGKDEGSVSTDKKLDMEPGADEPSVKRTTFSTTFMEEECTGQSSGPTVLRLATPMS